MNVERKKRHVRTHYYNSTFSNKIKNNQYSKKNTNYT